jgi:shikimate dehydrogenase
MTRLLKDAQSKGHPVITGIGMLLHQARPAFKEWYGMMPAITPELQQKLENA